MYLSIIFVIIAMTAINAVFAAYEISLAAVSMARLESLAKQHRPGAKAALAMKTGVERSLAALQIGITLVGAISAASGGAGATTEIAPSLRDALHVSNATANVFAIALVVVPLTVLTIIFGELVPKVFAIRNKEAVCLWLSPWFRWFALSLWPVVWAVEKIVHVIIHFVEHVWHCFVKPKEKSEPTDLLELHAQAAYARAARLIGERQEGIIVGAARLSHRPVREIMLPAEHICMLDVNESVTNCLIAAHLDMHTRYPVTERAGDPQQIIGYVNFKDIVALMRLSMGEKPELRKEVRQMPSLAEDASIAACMERLIHEHAHIALVRDAADVVTGMITLEDILEEFVGDIQDEYDRLPAHAIPAGQAWIVGGGIPLAKIQEITGVNLAPQGEISAAKNLSDLVAARLERPAHSGEILECGGLRIMVRKIRRQKVLEAQIARVVP